MAGFMESLRLTTLTRSATAASGQEGIVFYVPEYK